MSNLKELRKSKGVTLREVEEATGLPHSILSALENGKRPFRQRHLQLLSGYFECSYDCLLGRTIPIKQNRSETEIRLTKILKELTDEQQDKVIKFIKDYII